MASRHGQLTLDMRSSPDVITLPLDRRIRPPGPQQSVYRLETPQRIQPRSSPFSQSSASASTTSSSAFELSSGAWPSSPPPVEATPQPTDFEDEDELDMLSTQPSRRKPSQHERSMARLQRQRGTVDDLVAPPRGGFGEAENLILIRLCITNSEHHGSGLWQIVALQFAEETGYRLSNPQRNVAKLVKTWKAVFEQRGSGTGTENETEMSSTMRQWLAILDERRDLQEREKHTREQAAHEALRTQQDRDNFRLRMGAKRPLPPAFDAPMVDITDTAVQQAVEDLQDGAADLTLDSQPLQSEHNSHSNSHSNSIRSRSTQLSINASSTPSTRNKRQQLAQEHHLRTNFFVAATAMAEKFASQPSKAPEVAVLEQKLDAINAKLNRFIDALEHVHGPLFPQPTAYPEPSEQGVMNLDGF